VVFVLKLAHHPTFTRLSPTSSDLHVTVSVTLSEALLGFSRIVLKHLDGRGIRTTRKPGEIVKGGETIVIRGEGMPERGGDGKGDLFVTLEVEMPSKEWFNNVDAKALEAMLPPKKAELEPRPTIVEDAKWEEADMEDYEERAHEEEWEDEDGDEDEGFGFGTGPFHRQGGYRSHPRFYDDEEGEDGPDCVPQ